MEEEKIKQALEQVQQQYTLLKKEFGDTSLEPSTLSVGQKNTSLYLSTQQIDLLLLVNVNSPEALIEYVQNCVQLNGFTLGDINEENLEEKKREVFAAYLNSYIPYKDLVVREGFTEKDSLNRRILFSLNKNLPQEYISGAVTALNVDGELGLVRYLSTIPNGEKYLRDIGRFISLDFENIQGVTYDEIVGLDELIKRDSTIVSIVSISPTYSLSMHYDSDGVKKFDPYFADRALAYCKITDKHMRYNSLFSRLAAMDLYNKGYDKETVMQLMSTFADGFFGYLSEHDETLKNGSRLIDCVQVFSELLRYEPGQKDGKNTGMVWQEYFGMTMEDLFSIIFKDGKSRVPDGVDVMYNETALEEGVERLESCDSIIRDIYRVAPGFVNVFGNQLHVYDSLLQNENIHMLHESAEFMKRVQNDYGIKIQITEHDLNISGDMVRNCQRYGVSMEYIRLLKKKYQQMVSNVLLSYDLDIDTVDYWSIFDKVDHNLRRDIEGRIKRGESIQGIDSLHAGLLPEGSNIKKIPSLNPSAYERQLNQEQNKVKKLEYPTETGSISIVLVMVIMIIVLLALIGFCLIIM